MKFLITSSKNPSRRTRTLCKEIEFALGGYYIQRGNTSIKNIFEYAEYYNFKRILIIYEEFGNPHQFSFFNKHGEKIGLSLIAKSVSLAREKHKSYNIFSGSIVVSPSKEFKVKEYLFIISSLFGIKVEFKNKLELLRKYSSILLVSSPISTNSIFNIRFLTLKNDDIIEFGPTISIKCFKY